MAPYPYSHADESTGYESIDMLLLFLRLTPSILFQRSPRDLLLDLQDVIHRFTASYTETIDNLSLHVFQPRRGFRFDAMRDGTQPIIMDIKREIRRAMLISGVNGSVVLCVNVPCQQLYFYKSQGRWRKIEFFEYLDILEKARSIRPIKDIAIDASNKVAANGLVIDTDKFGSTSQVTFKPDLGYVARSVRYGDYVIWKAKKDTQRCMRATVFLKRNKPIGMSTLIYVDGVQIAQYRFENDRWTYVDEDDYMKMVRSYKPFLSKFPIENQEPYYWLAAYLS